jgi:NAD(P)-dependent dehydrogenase (short-subunit alcohol dehydrogenase family)/SAM-dependent methyltransferase
MSSQHLLLGHRIQSAIAGDRLEFEIRPNEELRPYAHDLLGTPVLSSAACLEIALAAGIQVLRSDRLVLEDVTFREPIVLDEHQAGALRLVLTRVDSATYGFEIFRGGADDRATQSSWTVKAAGTIHGESTAAPDAAGDLARAQADCSKQIPVDEFYASLAARGIEYAPRSHSLEQLWEGPGRAFGRVHVPIDAGSRADSGTFNPLVLDGCLQVAAAALPERLRNSTFVQIAIGRMRLYSRPGPLLWSEAHVEENGDDSTDSVTARVRLFDSEGHIVAELENILLKQVDPDALARSASNSYRSWLYEVVWRAVPAYGGGGAAEGLAAPGAVVEEVRRGGGLRAGRALAAYDRALRELEERSIDYVQRALAAVGWTGRRGERTTTAALQQRLAIVPRYGRLLARLLGMLAETGWLRQEGEAWEVRRAWPAAGTAPGPGAVPDPVVAAEWALLERCGRALPAVLRGTCDPVELLFPAGDLQTAARLYRDAPGAQVMNGLVQQAVAAAVRGWPAGRGLRVLEIGGGTGGTTEAVLAALPADRTDYTFTDISPRFLTAAEGLGAAWGGRLHGAVLDIERPPAAQAVPGPYGLVIAANVLHATRDLRETLQHVHAVLAPGGVLVVLEATVPTRFIDLIFGVTEGWWRFADLDLRAAHPLLGADQWTALLDATGLAPAAALTAPDGTAGEVLARQAVIVAQRAAGPAPRAPRRWLILADEGGVGAALATQLRERGDPCRLLYAAPGPADARARVAADRPGPLAEAIATAGPVDAVVHLWSLDTASPDPLTPASLRAGCAHSCGSALHLTQALLAHRPPPRLYLVTRGAQPVDSHAGNLALVQAPIGGLAKTIAREHPDFRSVAIDLDPRESAPAAALFDEICSAANDREEQIALRRGVRYVSRLVSKRADDGAPPVTLVPNATYLVTGATRGIGLKVARWMSDHGARHLLLLARRPADDTAAQTVLELQKTGTDVRLVQGDVADMAHVRDVLNAVRQSPWPLKGVIHCAGVFQDKLLADHRWELFDEVFAAKISGSWNLHALTLDMELDFFVMFSSAAALFGATGLANYVAANEFMDRLAQQRAKQNLPALSVNWGPWLGTGMAQAVTAKRASQWTSAGIEQFSSHAALRALEYLMGLKATQAAVVKANWSRVRDQFARDMEPRFLELVSTDGPAIKTATHDFRTALEAAAPVDRRALLTSHVRGVIARVLGLDSSDSLDPRQGLFDAGLDSLTTMELRNQLQASLGCTLGATFAFMYPNLDALVNHLATEQLGLEDTKKLECGDVQPQVASPVPAPHSVDSAESLDLRIARELEALESLLN